ncbi:hypothetical protein ACFLZM_00155 [Thermodesulfobacteriota bacterium]
MEYWEDKVVSLENELLARLNDPDYIRAWAIKKAQISCAEKHKKADQDGISLYFNYNLCIRDETIENIRWWPRSRELAKNYGQLRDVEEIKKELTDARRKLEIFRKTK